MKLTNLSEAPGKLEAPPRAFRRFAAVRTGSQLIPGVGRTFPRGGAMMGRLQGRLAWVAGAGVLLLVGCATGHGIHISYGPGRTISSGYWIEYLDASPAPGTFLEPGASVSFNVKVRYTLMRSEVGAIRLQFADQSNESLLPERSRAVAIHRCKNCVQEISQEVTVPPKSSELMLRVFVVPEGERHPGGELRIKYFVGPGQREQTSGEAR
jgi:hypothetical protein